MQDVFKCHVVSSFNISENDFERLIEEINNYYKETPEEFIRHRHFQLKQEGHKNELIYKKIKDELKSRRFSAGEFTERQIRRIIYG